MAFNIFNKKKEGKKDDLESVKAKESRSAVAAKDAVAEKDAVDAKNMDKPAGEPANTPRKGSSKFSTDYHLKDELSRLHKLKEKKLLSHSDKKRFTIKGFIRAVELQRNLEKAGLNKDAKQITREVLRITTAICTVLTIIVLAIGFYNGRSFSGLLVFLLAGWITVYFLLLGIVWACYLFYLDMRIFKRTQAVEFVFPDFLQLASSNISAGMPVDRALWYAVRPNFGVLAKEIEIVAKNTMAGQDIGEALRDFANKYNSKVILRSVNLMLEGLAAGGEMADLLNKIALNIEESRILKKEMAANVTTYIIFITFATIMAAPFLFALSTQLLTIIQAITGKISGATAGSNSFFSFSFSSDSVKVVDFKIFSYVTLAISAASSACIVTMIQKGNIKEGISKIPIYILISLTLYTVATIIMGIIFSGMVTG
jgi:archaeal flagellar protein FlaJ